MTASTASGAAQRHAGRGRGLWSWVIWTLLLWAGVLLVVGEVVVERAGPILKGRVIETLRARFDGRVELDELDVSVLQGLEVSGKGLRIFAPDEVVAAGATAPLIAVREFEFHTGLRGLFLKPMHVDAVHVTGMVISVPPREMRVMSAANSTRSQGKVKILVSEVVCDDSRMVMGTLKPGKVPKVFELRHVVLRGLGAKEPMEYDATVINAIPRGDIHAVGTFGPWVERTPGDSPISGRYTFDHADLATIKGIGGVLSSAGEFRGALNRMAVNGTAEVPNFSLDTARHPMPLHTAFRSTVDGTTGDTYLERVDARLGESEFTCAGSVVNQKGVGHTIDLQVAVPNGRLEDFLRTAVKTRPVVMTARLELRAKLHIRPGKESVAEKLRLEAQFGLRGIHFTNAAVQDKVDVLSLRAQGYAADAKPGAPDVPSEMRGTFVMSEGRLRFSDLHYTMPGATVALSGVYSLDGEQFDFAGKVRTQAKVSQMVTSWWKQMLLYPVNPFFAKNGAGAEVPVTIRGTQSAPKIGLDLFHRHEKEKR